MSKTKRNIVNGVFLFFLLFASCNENKFIEYKKFNIGEKIKETEIIPIDTINDSILVRKVKYKKDSSFTLYTYSKENILFFYIINDLDNKKFSYYSNFYKTKFKRPPQFIDSTLSSGSFICTKYIWKDSITEDFVILSSCKNIKDTITNLETIWDMEVGNDTLIAQVRSYNN